MRHHLPTAPSSHELEQSGQSKQKKKRMIAKSKTFHHHMSLHVLIQQLNIQ